MTAEEFEAAFLQFLIKQDVTMTTNKEGEIMVIQYDTDTSDDGRVLMTNLADWLRGE